MAEMGELFRLSGSQTPDHNPPKLALWFKVFWPEPQTLNSKSFGKAGTLKLDFFLRPVYYN